MSVGTEIYSEIPPSPAIRICLDLPVPPSVNRLRKIDWAYNRARQQFYLHADLQLSAYGPHPAPVRMITGPFELHIQAPDDFLGDLDNICKSLIDYLVSREFIPDDSKQYLRRLVVEWGSPVPACRVTITGV